MSFFPTLGPLPSAPQGKLPSALQQAKAQLPLYWPYYWCVLH